MSSPIKNSKLKPKMPKMPGMPQLIVDPKPGVFDMGPNPPKEKIQPKKPLPIRQKSGIPNGPTVGKVYKTY
jgi:hypothetical protein